MNSGRTDNPESFDDSFHDQAALEAKLKRLRPRPPEIDFDKIEASLVNAVRAGDDRSLEGHRDAVVPARGGGWGPLAAAWGLGVAAGILVMVFIRPVEGNRPIGETIEREPASPQVTSTENAAPPAGERISPGDFNENTFAASEPSKDAEESLTLQRNLRLSTALLEVGLSSQDLRAGTHLIAMTRSVETKQAQTSGAANGTVPESSANDGPGWRAAEPLKPPQITTPRSSLDEMIRTSATLF